jgi:exopolyphosphatase/pppGpp-phosphohydrolase
MWYQGFRKSWGSRFASYRERKRRYILLWVSGLEWGGLRTDWFLISVGAVRSLYVYTMELFTGGEEWRTEEQIRAVQSRFRALLETLPEDGGATVVGTAGTPTTLAALDLGIDDYDPTLVNGHVLSRETVDIQRKALLGIPASERLELSGMEAGREDLIAAGILMVEEVMDRWGFRELIVSDWGLLEGAALEAAKGVKGER